MSELDPAALRADPRVLWNDDILRFGDTDLNGHINNAAFAVLAESGRVGLFREAFGPMRREHGYFVVVRLAIDFRAELHYPGAVRTATWIARVGRTSLALGQVILSGDLVAATTDAVCVSMDRATRRPTPLDDAMRGKAQALLRE